MANGIKQIKYGELGKDFFGRSQELVQEAKGEIKAQPDKGKSAGRTFMQAYFGHVHGVSDFCNSMDNLCVNTRKRLKDSGAAFKDIDEEIAYSVAKEG